MSIRAQTQLKTAPTPSFDPARSNLLQHKCACGGTPGPDGECSACRQKRLSLQRYPTSQANLTTVPLIAHEALRTSGQPLVSAIRAFMEPRFGHDFSEVRVRTSAPERIQTKPTMERPGDRYEREADQVAEQSTLMPELLTPRAPSLSCIQPMIQRLPDDGAPASTPPTVATAPAPTESAVPSETRTPGLIVEDSAAELGPGQMKKSEFLSQLRTAVCSASEEALAGTGRSSSGCPYLDYWFGYHSAQDSQHIERAIRKYAPETSGVTSAGDFIPFITERVRRDVTVWVTTGQTTSVPEGMPTEVTRSASTTGSVLLKSRDGGAREADDPEAIQAQLGSGRPFDTGVRSRMESAFGHDFSRVRMHTDARAADLSASLNARAFTVGEHVAFGSGEYQPGTLIGDAIIAHELAHVVQQGGISSSPAPKRRTNIEYNSLEEDADQSAVGAVVSLWSDVKGTLADLAKNAMPRLRSGLRLQRCDRLFSSNEKDVAQEAGLPAEGTPGAATTPAPPPTIKPTPIPAAATKPCDGSVDADKVIVDHRVDPSPAIIEKPGDKVTFTVTFACQLKGDGFSKLVAPGGSEFSRESFAKGLGQYTRAWDGKMLFAKVGTYLVDDGDYRHRLEPVKYAIKGGKDLLTTGPKHDSPIVKVNARGFKGSGKDHFHFTSTNADLLAEIIESEIGIGSVTEKKAVAWCVRNQMIRMGTARVEEARDHFGDAHDQAATSGSKTIAEEILKKPMSDDITSGSIKWFSPRSMPKEGESCAGKDCKGGLISVTDDARKARKAYAPSWHKTMTFVPVTGVQEWYLRVYKL